MSQVSKSEQALEALYQVINDGATGVLVERNDVKLDDVPETGRVSVRDGKIDIDATMLGGMGHDLRHEASVVISFQHTDARTRSAGLDALNVLISNLLQGDLTLSGAVDYLEQSPLRIEEENVEGAAPIRYAEKVVTLYYSVQNNTI